MDNNIPKIIHYCWFGQNELPELAKKCINSWSIYFPDYEIKEWNESNFDMSCCKYVQDAYKEKKWAHVSDYVRFYVLYTYGGIYFDTDVEIIKSFDDVLLNGPFMGCEKTTGSIATGLGFASNRKNEFIKEILNDYDNSEFYNKNGEMDIYNTVVVRVSKLLKKYGYIEENKIQKIRGFTIYTKEYFNPMIYESGQLEITKNTHSIHWYNGSWLPKGDRVIHLTEQKIKKVFSGHFGHFICYVYRKSYRVLETLKIIR